MVDVAPVPQRFEDPVPEAEDQQVADRLLAQVVVDAVDLRLPEHLADLAVEALRGLEVVAERLLDHDPPPATVVVLVIEPDAAKLGHDVRELGWLCREVEQPVAVRPVLGVEVVEVTRKPIEATLVIEVHLVVGDPLRERSPRVCVEREDAAVLLQRLADLSPEILVVVTRAGRSRRAGTRAAAGSSARAGTSPG